MPILLWIISILICLLRDYIKIGWWCSIFFATTIGSAPFILLGVVMTTRNIFGWKSTFNLTDWCINSSPSKLLKTHKTHIKWGGLIRSVCMRLWKNGIGGMRIVQIFITTPKHAKTASRFAAIWHDWQSNLSLKINPKKPLKCWIYRWKKCHWTILGITVCLLQLQPRTIGLEVPKKEVNLPHNLLQNMPIS